MRDMMSSPSVEQALLDAVRWAAKNNREAGFWIYRNTLTGAIWVGSSMYGNYNGINDVDRTRDADLRGTAFTEVIGMFHTHPTHERPSPNDLTTIRNNGVIGLIYGLQSGVLSSGR